MKAKLLAITLCLVAVVLVAHAPHALATSSSSTTVTIYNPLPSSDIRVIIGYVIKGLLSIIGSIALLMFVYGGVMWLTSYGNPERVKKGKEILVWTVMGIGVIFAAYAMTNAVINALVYGCISGSCT